MQISNIIKTFERDLKVKNYADNTISNYVSQVNKFLIYFQQKDSPKHISFLGFAMVGFQGTNVQPTTNV